MRNLDEYQEALKIIEKNINNFTTKFNTNRTTASKYGIALSMLADNVSDEYLNKCKEENKCHTTTKTS